MERKKNPSAFIRNTYTILERSQHNHIITWNQQGNGFIIHDLPKFEAQILPQYFKHQKYTSFVRQLNMYGFHKQRHPLTENYFQHETFRRGQNLNQIKRKPERKKRSEQGTKNNQGTQQEIRETSEMMEQGQSEIQMNPEQNQIQMENRNRNKNKKIEQNQEIIKQNEVNQEHYQHTNQKEQSKTNTCSFISLCQQAILQNQILVKLQSIFMSYQVKFKEQKLREMKEEAESGQNYSQILGTLGQIVKSQTLRLHSFLDSSL